VIGSVIAVEAQKFGYQETSLEIAGEGDGTGSDWRWSCPKNDGYSWTDYLKKYLKLGLVAALS
jgi:hypothetical protein